MDERYSTKRLLALRRLTRATADLLRGHLRDYLGTLAPLFRPRAVLGDHVKGGPKEVVRGADTAFKELQALHETIATAKPFGLPKELTTPLDPITAGLEIAAVEYSHAAKADSQTKTVVVTTPLRWVLSYAGHGPKRLRELVADPGRSGTDLGQGVLHTLVLDVIARQPGLAGLFQALRFPLSNGKLPGLGELPFTYLTAAVPTVRPPDDVIIESTEIAGMDTFEEVVDLDELARLRDPLREQLLNLAVTHGVELPAT